MNVTLPVSALEVCDRARVRHLKPKEQSDVVGEYAEAYECGLITEPLQVFREKGTERYVVADGEHRLLALRRTKIKEVGCQVHEGDELDALRFAIGCNQKHGLRRTKADIYYAFTRVMETTLRDEFRTDTNLSELLGVSVTTVKRYKADWRNDDAGDVRVQKKKTAARQSAEKHSSEPRTNGALKSEHVNGSVGRSQPDESSREIFSPTRIEAPKGSSVDAKSVGAAPPDPERGYASLRAAWDAASDAARSRLLEEEGYEL